MKMQAAVLCELGKPLQVMELDIPVLSSGQVLVKVIYSGVCRSQLMEVQGRRGEDPWLPHLLGHEGTGEVVDVGAEVTKVKVGDYVILGWIKADGYNASGACYSAKNFKVNAGPVTTFSNYTIVSENRLVRMPANLGYDVGVLFGCALLTGAGIIFNELKPKAHEHIAVIGLGGVGLSALMALKEQKPASIIALDISSEKLHLAEKLGATYIVNTKHSSIHEQIGKIAPHGLDACVESAGHVDTIELAFSLLRRNGGRLYFASHPPKGQKISIDPFELISGKKIYGTWGGASKPDMDVPRLAKLYGEGQLPLKSLITHIYALEEINEALKDLESGDALRPLIKMQH